MTWTMLIPKESKPVLKWLPSVVTWKWPELTVLRSSLSLPGTFEVRPGKLEPDSELRPGLRFFGSLTPCPSASSSIIPWSQTLNLGLSQIFSNWSTTKSENKFLPRDSTSPALRLWVWHLLASPPDTGTGSACPGEKTIWLSDHYCEKLKDCSYPEEKQL